MEDTTGLDPLRWAKFFAAVRHAGKNYGHQMLGWKG